MTPKIRQSLYAVGTIATSILTLLSVWQVLDPAATSALSMGLTAVLSLLGVGAAGTAAVITGKQRKDGTFESLSPVDQVVAGLEGVVAQAETAKSDFERVKDAVASVAVDVVDDVPVVGGLAAQILAQLNK